MTYVKRRKSWRMSFDVGEVMERLENELCHDIGVPSIDCEYKNVSNLRVLGRKKEIYALVAMGTVIQLVRAPDQRTGDLWFKSRLRQKFLRNTLFKHC